MPEFRSDLSHYEEMRLLYSLAENTQFFSPPICAALAQAAQILTREI